MTIRVEQWKAKLAIVNHFEQVEDTIQAKSNLGSFERFEQIRTCRDQIRQGRAELDELVGLMTPAELGAASEYYALNPTIST